MGTKICNKCKKEKALVEFYFRKDQNKYRNECKECCLDNNSAYCKRNKIRIKKKQEIYRDNKKKAHPYIGSYKSAQNRCNSKKNKDYHRYSGRGIKFLMTLDDFKYIWFRDKAYNMEQPEIDREDNDGHYESNNCRFIEKELNNKKRHKDSPQGKNILQYDLDGNFIKEFKSVVEASNITNINFTSISNCACNRKYYLTAGGFVWKYKEIS